MGASFSPRIAMALEYVSVWRALHGPCGGGDGGVRGPRPGMPRSPNIHRVHVVQTASCAHLPRPFLLEEEKWGRGFIKGRDFFFR